VNTSIADVRPDTLALSLAVLCINWVAAPEQRSGAAVGTTELRAGTRCAVLPVPDAHFVTRQAIECSRAFLSRLRGGFPTDPICRKDRDHDACSRHESARHFLDCGSRVAWNRKR
jgi:hypothetical protein